MIEIMLALLVLIGAPLLVVMLFTRKVRSGVVTSRKLVCVDCKKQKKGDIFTYNEPYLEEHENIEVEIILCEKCYYDRTLRI